jgi:hypothetical protein
MKRIDGGLGFPVTLHFDEPESARSTSVTIIDDPDGGYCSKLLERRSNRLFRRTEIQIANIDIHSETSVMNTPSQIRRTPSSCRIGTPGHSPN